jgi:protein dithiol oxidoreductase (disulfide-forming)
MKTFFSICLTGVVMFSSVGSSLASKPAPVEGKEYKTLRSAAPTELGKQDKKIVVEAFFWYACGHCNDFEPDLANWTKKQLADVSVHGVPVEFDKRSELHSRLYYALEAIGRLDLHQAFFHTVHQEKKFLMKEEELLDWAAARGVDRARFAKVFKSFSVQAKVKAANQKAQAYGVESVPVVVVDGKYLTSPHMAGPGESTLAMLDYLVEKRRQEKKI